MSQYVTAAGAHGVSPSDCSCAEAIMMGDELLEEGRWLGLHHSVPAVVIKWPAAVSQQGVDKSRVFRNEPPLGAEQ